MLAGCSHSDAPAPEGETSAYILLGASDAAGLYWQPVAESRAEASIPADEPETIGVYGFNDSADKGDVFGNVPMYRIDGDALQQQPWYDPATFTWYGTNRWAYENPVPWLRSSATKPVYYKFYGYSPYQAANVDLTVPTFAGMQRLTIGELPRYMAEDLMVAENVLPYTAHTAVEGANPWQLLKMRHMYARLRFCFKLAENYGELRYLHLKRMEVFDIYDQPMQLTVEFSQNSFGEYLPIEVSWLGDASRGAFRTVPLRNEGGAEYVVLSSEQTEYQALASLYVYPGDNLRNVNIRVVYDVYDVHGQLLRQDDTVTNQISLNLWASGDPYGALVLDPGYYFNCNILVQPTFLYVLSDNDNGYDGYLVIEP